MRRLATLVLIALAPPLLACSGLLDPAALEEMTRPVPPPSPQWSGRWEGAGMSVTITPEGFVEILQTATSGTNTTSNVVAPARSWADGELEVGIGVLTSTWRVDEAPYEKDGTWRMVIEGVVLERVGDAPHADAHGALGEPGAPMQEVGEPAMEAPPAEPPPEAPPEAPATP